MADLLLQIPKQIEHGFGDPLAPIVVVRGQQKKQIDVGAGRQCRASIAADRRDDETPGRRRGRGMKIGHRERVQSADQFVFELGEIAGTGEAAARRVEHFARTGAAGLKRIAEKPEREIAQIVAASCRRRGPRQSPWRCRPDRKAESGSKQRGAASGSARRPR